MTVLWALSVVVTPRDIQTSNFDIRISPLVKFTTTKDKFVKPAFTNNTQM